MDTVRRRREREKGGTGGAPFDIVDVAYTVNFPMGIYSEKHESFEALPAGWGRAVDRRLVARGPRGHRRARKDVCD